MDMTWEVNKDPIRSLQSINNNIFIGLEYYFFKYVYHLYDNNNTFVSLTQVGELWCLSISSRSLRYQASPPFRVRDEVNTCDQTFSNF